MNVANRFLVLPTLLLAASIAESRADGPADSKLLAPLSPAARAAVDKAAPKAEWSTVNRYDKGSETAYLLQGKDAKGRLIGLAVTPAGKVVGFGGEVDKEEMPEAVRRVVDKAAPDAKLSQCVRETEDGRTRFDVTGKDGAGRSFLLALAEDGRVERHEVSVPKAEVPKKFLESIEKGEKFRGYKMVEFKRSLKPDGTPKGYLIEMVNDRGEQIAAATEVR